MNKVNKIKYFWTVLSLYFISLNNVLFANATGLKTEAEFQENLNIFLTNASVVFINFVIGLAILIGIIAFIVQLIRLNTYHELPKMREMAIRQLYGIVIATSIATMAGLIFVVLIKFVLIP